MKNGEEKESNSTGVQGPLVPPEDPGDDYYINAPDIFYWMDDPCDADIPLTALGIDIPLGCRFCI